MINFNQIIENYDLSEENIFEVSSDWINNASQEQLQDYLQKHNPSLEVKQQIMAAISRLEPKGGKNNKTEPQSDNSSNDTEIPPITKKEKYNLVVGKQYKSDRFGDIWIVLAIIENGTMVRMKSIDTNRVMIFNVQKVLNTMSPV